MVLALGVGAIAGPTDASTREASSESECLALTLYWEALEEGRRGMVAVAWVVLNRKAHAGYPSSICGVVRDGGQTPPCQFSFWCDGRSDAPTHAEGWRLARAVATEMVTNPPRDPTRGALFFHAVTVSPRWAHARERTVRIGRHVYYR